MLSDLRQKLYKETFPKGLSFNEYLKSGTENQSARWLNNFEQLKIDPELEEVIQNYKRQMKIFVLSGIWCGDCMRQGPMIAKICELSPQIECRFFDNQLFPEIREELRILGGTRVPVTLICSEDFFEVCRYGDKTYSHYLNKIQTELGNTCSTGIAGVDKQQSKIELQEWFQIIDRAQNMLRLSSSLRSRYGD